MFLKTFIINIILIQLKAGKIAIKKIIYLKAKTQFDKVITTEKDYFIFFFFYIYIIFLF